MTFILNNLNYFLQQTPPPDNHSHSTFSDNSYMSTMESVATVVYPPIPVHDQNS
ncbi:hypothetical protein RhiirA5_441515 [Rhizophagus irregularis]|uniref:Uncharacterized protein n=1 Tax=Rhizophagus irregularis TaxID=588596 RepID=A0A2N0NFI5_9GLOM|nr:hypothetical protein RhiirA5_441515 [Rhizophagus irregularis]